MSVAQWIVGSFLMLSAIVMIITVLMQSSERTGIGAVSGAAETFFGKNKARGMDALLARVTVVLAVLFAVITIVIARMTS